MLDNLRRTLSAPAALLTLIAAWTLPFASALVWTPFVLVDDRPAGAAPVPLAGSIPRRRGISKRSHLRAVGADLAFAVAQVGLAITLLAHQAWLMTDAIVRTLGRLYVTRRHLLEWMTAAQSEAGRGFDLLGFYRRIGGHRPGRRRGCPGGGRAAGGVAHRGTVPRALGALTRWWPAGSAWRRA